MTKYKELHRAVQHLADYQMNGRVGRRAAPHRALLRESNARQRRPRHEIFGGAARAVDGATGSPEAFLPPLASRLTGILTSAWPMSAPVVAALDAVAATASQRTW